MINAEQASETTKDAVTNLVDEIGRDVAKAATDGFFKLTYRRIAGEVRFADAVLVNTKLFEDAGYVIESDDDKVSLDWGTY